jgi:serine/threonine protein kinase
MAIAMAHINEMPPALPESIDPRVQNLVLSCLAKKPTQRPESATSLAIRAEALLREKRKVSDQSVPKPKVEKESPVTEVFNAQTAPLPRAPIVWPWIATLVLLGITAVVVIVAILSDTDIDGIDTTPTQTQTQTPAPTASSEPTESDEPGKVLVLRSDVIGENLSTVTARLTEQGFKVNAIPGELIPGTDPRVRTVYAVSPTGSITKGSVIDVTYYVGNFEDIPVEIPEPEPEEPEDDSDADTDSPEVEPGTDTQPGQDNQTEPSE